MANPPSPRLHPAPRGYSLIELLAVMAILSALAGLTVGSLSPVKANALTAGGNQITDLLVSARQNSISRHAFTAVVIKSAGDARYSAHCLFELTRNDDGNFAAWKMLAPWRLLPEGVRFDPEAPVIAPAANFLSMNPTPPSSPSALPSPRSIPWTGRRSDERCRLPNFRAGRHTHERCSGAASSGGGRRRRPGMGSSIRAKGPQTSPQTTTTS